MSHLLAFLQPDETAAQLIARTNVDPVNTGLFFASVLRPGQVLEITGPSGAAKSEVLIQVQADAQYVLQAITKHYGIDPPSLRR